MLCAALTKMRVRNDRLNPKLRGGILCQPKKCCCATINQVIAAIIFVNLEEKFHIAVEYKSLTFCPSLHFCCPCTDFVGNLRIVHVCFRDDGESWVSVKIFLALWLDASRPLWRHVHWARSIKLNFWNSTSYDITAHEGFREDWNIPDLTMQGVRLTLKSVSQARKTTNKTTHVFNTS